MELNNLLTLKDVMVVGVREHPQFQGEPYDDGSSDGSPPEMMPLSQANIYVACTPAASFQYTAARSFSDTLLFRSYSAPDVGDPLVGSVPKTEGKVRAWEPGKRVCFRPSDFSWGWLYMDLATTSKRQRWKLPNPYDSELIGAIRAILDQVSSTRTEELPEMSPILVAAKVHKDKMLKAEEAGQRRAIFSAERTLGLLWDWAATDLGGNRQRLIEAGIKDLVTDDAFLDELANSKEQWEVFWTSLLSPDPHDNGADEKSLYEQSGFDIQALLRCAATAMGFQAGDYYMIPLSVLDSTHVVQKVFIPKLPLRAYRYRTSVLRIDTPVMNLHLDENRNSRKYLGWDREPKPLRYAPVRLAGGLASFVQH